MSVRKRLFVLDTNVLIQDPTAVFRFKEHDVFIPMVVLEELDAVKQGSSELARGAREVSRILDDLIGDSKRDAIEGGLPLPTLANSSANCTPSGRLLLQTIALEQPRDVAAFGNTNGDHLLAIALNLRAKDANTDVTLVSKDINLRIKARVCGIWAEDYYNDKTLNDIDLLYTGMHDLEPEILHSLLDSAKEIQDNDRTLLQISTDTLDDYFSNEFLGNPIENLEFVVRPNRNGCRILEPLRDFRLAINAVWGITARNVEQNFALNLLMDPEVEFVSLLGVAGTGKTLLALAAGLAQAMESKRYVEIIMTRETISVGEEIGFLPGSEEEKMTPWMGALLDNLEVLTDVREGGDWGRAAGADLIQKRVKIRSLGFMRGRTFQNRYIIIDEAQNLTAKQMRTLITRAGSGSKIICLGNIAQIDSPYLSETTSGLTFVVDRFRQWDHSGHVTLTRGERSRLADFATAHL